MNSGTQIYLYIFYKLIEILHTKMDNKNRKINK